MAGQWALGRQSLDEAFAFADRVGDIALREYLAASELQLRLHTDPSLEIDEFVEVTSRCLQVLDRVRATTYAARVRLVLAWAYALQGQACEAERLVLQNLKQFPQKQLLPTLWLCGPLHVDQAVRRCEGFLAGTLDPRASASVYRALALLNAMTGKFDDARELISRSQKILQELGLAVMAATASAVGAPIEFLAQDPAEAERLLRTSLKDLDRLGATHDRGGLAAYLAEALYEQGRISEARAALESAAERTAQDVVYVVRIRTIRAKLLANDGDHKKAAATAQEAVRIADSTDSTNLRAEARFSLGQVLKKGEHRSEAASTFRDSVERFEAKGNVVASRRAHAELSDVSADVPEPRERLRRA